MIYTELPIVVNSFCWLVSGDTNIFLADESKTTVYEIANSVPNLIYKYMKCNLLHINYKKCCLMYFSPHILFESHYGISVWRGILYKKQESLFITRKIT